MSSSKFHTMNVTHFPFVTLLIPKGVRQISGSTSPRVIWSYEKDAVAVIARLSEEPEIQKRWKNFCKKILKYELDFSEVVKTIIDFTSTPYESIVHEDEFFKSWSFKEKKYT